MRRSDFTAQREAIKSPGSSRGLRERTAQPTLQSCRQRLYLNFARFLAQNESSPLMTLPVTFSAQAKKEAG